jgi:hypothetical protein
VSIVTAEYFGVCLHKRRKDWAQAASRSPRHDHHMTREIYLNTCMRDALSEFFEKAQCS